MLFMPPGAAKSTYGSVYFPSYFIGRFEKKGVICATYSGDLSVSFGRKVRNLVSTDAYQNIFPIRLADDSKAKGEWEADNGSFYYAAGVGGAVTGRRGDIAIIDDPTKGRKDADSLIIRESTWEWYKADLRTRLKPGAAIVLIQTRWHEDDLAGRLLPERWDGESGAIECTDGEEWEVICLPAQARRNDALGRKEGEWLWPEYLTPKYWDSTKRAQTAGGITRNWLSLYQQTPSGEEGTFFKRDWFKRYQAGDEPTTRKYVTSDYAVTPDGGDFTEHGVWGVDAADDLYALDWWYGQEDSHTWIERLLDLVDEHRPLSAWGESGQIRRAIEPQLNKRSRERKVYTHYDWITRTKDKPAMAQAFRSRAAMGKVYIPYNDWGDRLIEQLCAFDGGKYDDAVDVCALIGLVIDKLAGSTEPAPEPKEEDVWGRRFRERASWKTN